MLQGKVIFWNSCWWVVLHVLGSFYWFIVVQDNQNPFLKLACIALDVLAVQASSVPCEHLFSSGKLIMTDMCSHLGHECFEELQVIKFAWHPALVDHAARNSNEVEELDVIKDFEDLLAEEQEILDWEKETFISVFYTTPYLEQTGYGAGLYQFLMVLTGFYYNWYWLVSDQCQHYLVPVQSSFGLSS